MHGRIIDPRAPGATGAVRYQACDARVCLLPKTETLRLDVPVETVDVQQISIHTGHGQREGFADAGKHMRRLVLRKARSRPFEFVRFIFRTLRLERTARRRLRNG